MKFYSAEVADCNSFDKWPNKGEKVSQFIGRTRARKMIIGDLGYINGKLAFSFLGPHCSVTMPQRFYLAPLLLKIENHPSDRHDSRSLGIQFLDKLTKLIVYNPALHF